MNSLSKTVIKAGATRLLPPDKRPLRSVAQEPGEAGADTAEREEREASYQIAYDEVIEAAQQEVALLLDDARRTAREIAEGAGAKAEKEREAAHADGFEKGIALGFDEGVQRTERALAGLLEDGQAEVDAALEAVYAARDAMLLEMEPRILRLSLDVAEKVLGYELDQSDEAFLSLVSAALDVIRCESRVTLRVNAEQHTGAFRSKASARLKTLQGGIEADIVTDMGVAPGGCLIETGNGTVDASVDAQLEQISRNMGIEDYD